MGRAGESIRCGTERCDVWEAERVAEDGYDGGDEGERRTSVVGRKPDGKNR